MAYKKHKNTHAW